MILADVEITDANCSGVIFAHGSRFGGYTLFIKDKKLHYVCNFLGIKPEQKFVSPDELKPGKYTLGVEFIRDKAGAQETYSRIVLRSIRVGEPAPREPSAESHPAPAAARRRTR